MEIIFVTVIGLLFENTLLRIHFKQLLSPKVNETQANTLYKDDGTIRLHGFGLSGAGIFLYATTLLVASASGSSVGSASATGVCGSSWVEPFWLISSFLESFSA